MNSRGLEHRAVRVSLVTGLSTALSVIFQIISVPVCLKYWGQETYGSWLGLFATFMLVRSLDAGYISYVGNKLNYLYHKETHQLRRHMGSAFLGVLLIGTLQLIVACCLFFSVQLGAMFGVPVSESDAAQDRTGLLILTVSWVLTGAYLGIVHRLLIPAGMMLQAAWCAMLFQVCQFAAIMLAALFNLDLTLTSLLFAFSQVLIYVSSGFYIRAKLPDYYPWWQDADISMGLSDLSKSMMLTASNVVQQASSSGLVLLISALAGPVALPLFTTVRTLSNLWTNLTNVLTTPLLPDVVRFHAKGETHKLATTVGAYWVVVGTVVNVSVLVAYPLIDRIYKYWTAQTMELDQALLCLLLAAVLVTNFGGLMAMHLNGVNRLRIVLSASVVRAAFCLGLGATLYDQYGLSSFGIGILFGEVIVLIMNGKYFVSNELTQMDRKTILFSLTSAFIGLSFTLAFLTYEGLKAGPLILSWPIALTSVVICGIWGWSRLDVGVRTRFMSLLPNRISPSN